MAHSIIKGTFQKHAVSPAVSLSSVMSQVLLEGETHCLLPPRGKLLRCGVRARSVLFFVLHLVHDAFKSIASALITGLALLFDPDNRLYLFHHHWGSLSTLNSNPLGFDLCLGTQQPWSSPPVGSPTGPWGPHKLEITYRITQRLPGLPHDPFHSCSRV